MYSKFEICSSKGPFKTCSIIIVYIQYVIKNICRAKKVAPIVQRYGGKCTLKQNSPITLSQGDST